MKVTIEFKILGETEAERELTSEQEEIVFGLLEEHLELMMDDAIEDLKLTENEELTWVFA